MEIIDINDIVINTKKYKNLNFNVSSDRIDVVIARIIGKSRKDVNNYINKGKIMLNYNILKKNSTNLKVNDVFSIQKYDKYIYRGIIKQTKKENLIISIDNYI